MSTGSTGYGIRLLIGWLDSDAAEPASVHPVPGVGMDGRGERRARRYATSRPKAPSGVVYPSSRRRLIMQDDKT
jgi:hypothetical protein